MLGYLVIAMLAGSIGFVLGGVLASNRGAALTDRLALAESALIRQAALTDELTQIVRELLTRLAGQAAGEDAEVIASARAALNRCEGHAAELHRPPVVPAEKEPH